MTTKHAYNVVDADFFATAPVRFDVGVDLDCTPERLFDIFEDAHAWTVWVTAIQKVEWTSPKPYGLGTTRTVHFPGGHSGDEVFIGWERGVHMSFCFTHATFSAFKTFAEDYHVRALPGGRCHLDWTFAADPRPAHRIGLKVFKPVMGFFLGTVMKSLQKYVKANPA